jgi:Zn-dependent protease with chaperone function/cell fate (sporulation/competence/biofilm development) regulator YmcA (YheA/YmcA/DUF963 family)
MKEIHLSSAFKSNTKKVILSINLFILTYIALLILGIALTISCIYVGILVIVFKPLFLTLVLGIGLASLGLLVLFFLIKFLFKSNKVDRSHLIEIKKSDEPVLFHLIKEIVKEVGTDFPKKIYIAPDVNACVFYDSSFWSMFLPVRKNLQIGLGLVNSVTKSELKAILSHEFGHFSQKSMKVGSYVYHVNQVIYNLLFENESYDIILLKWSNSSEYFRFFAMLANRIVNGIKWILNHLYSIINKHYFGLSREMEFHADEIAAHVTGYEPLASSLLRLSFADHSFNAALSFYINSVNENLRTENLYTDHHFTNTFLAKENKIEVKNNLPHLTEMHIKKFNKSKLNIKDQWASHPSIEDRVKTLKNTGITASTIDNTSANDLFSNIQKTQQEVTQKLFETVEFIDTCTILSSESFQEKFQEDYYNNSFPNFYNGFYDNKNPIYFDVNSIDVNEEIYTPDVLFSEKNIDTVNTFLSLQQDIETLKEIAKKGSDIKTFDYDGIKYNKEDCKELITRLEHDVEVVETTIKNLDIEIYRYFKHYELTNTNEQKVDLLYHDFFDYAKTIDAKYEIYSQLQNQLQFLNQITPFDEILARLTSILSMETRLKKSIQEILLNEATQRIITPSMRETFDVYLKNELVYFKGNAYNNENLEILFSTIHYYGYLLSQTFFILKQKLLNYQFSLVIKNTIDNPSVITD